MSSTETQSARGVSSQTRIETARDVLDLIGRTLVEVQNDQKAGTLERARVVGYLASTALKAVEAASLSARIEALELAASPAVGVLNG